VANTYACRLHKYSCCYYTCCSCPLFAERMISVKAYLLLADGTLFSGESLGATRETAGNLICYTGVVGFETILTDPASRGKIFIMTYPLVGNYGIAEEDMESPACQASGVVTGEVSKTYSNFRSSMSFEDFLVRNSIPAVTGVDTRALALHLRKNGDMPAIISTETSDTRILLNRLTTRMHGQVVPVDTGRFMDEEPCPPEAKPARSKHKPKVAVVDLGVRRSTLKQLSQTGFNTIICQPEALEDILAVNPDAVVLSTGPGNPDQYPHIIDMIRALLSSDTRLPLLGIGLGHLILARAAGATTTRMFKGHYGANYTVIDRVTGNAEITYQNHSYVVDKNTIPPGMEITGENLVDGSVEAIQLTTYPAFSTQYYPLALQSGEVAAEYNQLLAMVTRASG